MGDKVLVAYASRAGSTGEVAEAIGEVLRDRGATVDVRLGSHPRLGWGTASAAEGIVDRLAMHCN